jgi:uncharacterized protein YyaL (SSP411 family)
MTHPFKPIAAAAIALLSCGDSHEHHSPMPPTNALATETSPYLLQHAHNPVNWLPWSKEPFERAKDEGKLVLVSIGYSACHWCHVMEKETFEDEATADFMNEHFVNIKVDREERPDVDQVYMDAVQLMTGKGGWPLNCFTLADGRPIYGGTYFTKEKWLDVLNALVELQQNEPNRLEEYARELSEGLTQAQLIKDDSESELIAPETIDRLVNEELQYLDLNLGGSSEPPKFPLPVNLAFLQHYAFSHPNGDHSTVIEINRYLNTTLTAMARGGIYDQLGGGFSRYATDRNWKVPHFEKMLYDNAQLITLYCDGYAANPNDEFKNIALQTIDFVCDELGAPDGGFYSALDADSEGEEGRFYTWSLVELEQLLGDDFVALARHYQLTEEAVWENDRYILHRSLNETPNAIDPATLHRAKNILLDARNQRERPGLDDKQLVAWNALMVSALCNAWRTFGEQQHLNKAITAMSNLLAVCYPGGDTLYHTWKNGKPKINGYLDDYALTIDALIDLYQCTWDEQWLSVALTLVDHVEQRFSSEQYSLFWYTDSRDAALISRKHEIADHVIPSSNAVMAMVYFKLGALLNRAAYKQKSRVMVQTVSPYIGAVNGYAHWLKLAFLMQKPFYTAVIAGVAHDADQRLNFDAHYLPDALVIGGAADLELLRNKPADALTFYICIEGACKLPVNNLKDALEQMGRH